MNKILSLSILASAFALLLTGCGGKQLVTGAYPKQDATTDDYNIVAKAPDRGFMTSKATYLNETIAYTLQVAADQTLAKGYTYFAIVKPAEVSNTDGVMVNTSKEYLEKCATNNVLKGVFVLHNPCKIAIGSLEAPKGGTMDIRMYKSQDSSVMTYNANEVLSGIKTAGYDVSESK